MITLAKVFFPHPVKEFPTIERSIFWAGVVEWENPKIKPRFSVVAYYGGKYCYDAWNFHTLKECFKYISEFTKDPRNLAEIRGYDHTFKEGIKYYEYKISS